MTFAVSMYTVGSINVGVNRDVGSNFEGDAEVWIRVQVS